MGGRSSRAGTAHGMAATPVQRAPVRAAVPQAAPSTPLAQTPSQSPAAASQPPTGTHFPDLTRAQQQALLQAQRQRQTQARLLAIRDYTDPTPQANGYAMSQNANYAMENGLPLTRAQQVMINNLRALMGPIGAQTTLYRADHDNVLRQLGVGNYATMTQAQLKNALVGQTWTSKGLTSTSHNTRQNPFWPGNYMGGGREVQMRIHTSKTAKVALVQRSQAEVVLDVGTNFRVTGVRLTNRWARPRVGGRKRVVEIDVEAW